MNAIEFQDISFAYGEKKIIDHLTYSFPQSGLFVILGPSGCGKTTFLSLCTKTLLPSSGKIHFALENHPSIVFQSPLLLDYLNVRDNCFLPLAMEGKKLNECLAVIHDVLSLVGLEKQEERDVRTLSGGEQMRLAIARALTLDGSALILDEPTGQLDEHSSLEIYALLEKLSKDRLVLLVTHDQRNALSLDGTILKMEKGRLSPVKEVQGKKTGKVHSPGKSSFLPLSVATRWTALFLKKRRFRFLLSTFFLALTLSILALGLNISFHIDSGMDQWLGDFYDSQMLEVSLKDEIAEAGHLSLTRRMPVDQETCLQLGLNKSYPSLSYFFPESQEEKINGKKESFSFLPVISQNPKKIRFGKIAGRNEIVVNNLFLKAFSLTEEKAIGTSFVFSHSAIVRSSAFEQSDLVTLKRTFSISGICIEKDAFLTPTAYYDYSCAWESLSKIHLKNLSEERKELTSITAFFDLEGDASDDFRGTSVLSEAEDIQTLMKRSENLYQGSVEVSSKKEEIRESTTELVSSLLTVLLAFLAMTLFSAFMLAFLSVHSLYEDNIRLLALTRIYPGKKKNQRRIAFGMLISFLVSTSVFFLLLHALFTFVGKEILQMMGLPPFLAFFDLFSLLLSLFLALFFSVLATILPMRKVKEKEIKRHLEAED